MIIRQHKPMPYRMTRVRLVATASRRTRRHRVSMVLSTRPPA